MRVRFKCKFKCKFKFKYKFMGGWESRLKFKSKFKLTCKPARVRDWAGRIRVEACPGLNG